MMVKQRKKREKVVKLLLEVYVKEDLDVMEVAIAIGRLLKELDNKFDYGVYYGIEEDIFDCKAQMEEGAEEWDDEDEEKIPPNNHFEFKEVQ
jgi:uncharacterized protein (DUF849 family)